MPLGFLHKDGNFERGATTFGTNYACVGKRKEL
jgi:hypothetical protein